MDITLRARWSRGVAVAGFVVFLIVGLSIMTSTIVFGSIIAGISLVVIVCSARSGYLRLTGSELTVRTPVRTRRFRLGDIERAEPCTVVQVLPRVAPVIILESGRRYRLVDFAMQKWSYEKATQTPPFDGGLVGRTITAINTAVARNRKRAESPDPG